MKTLQIGAAQIQNYWQALLSQLHAMAERYGLDTAETEELTAWVFMAMESPLQNTSPVHQILTNGLPAFSLIMNDPKRQDAVVVSALQALEGVRYAAVIRNPRKPTKVIAYLK